MSSTSRFGVFPRFHPRSGITILLWIAGALYYCSYWDFGLNLWDEGVPLHGALRLLAGDRPYADFYGYQPGRYLLFALSFKLMGISVRGPRLLMGILGGALPALTYHCAAYLTPMAFSLAAAGMALVAPCCYYNRFFPLAIIAAMSLSIAYLRRRTAPALIWIGFLAVLVFYCKLEIGVMLLISLTGLSLLYPVAGRRGRLKGGCILGGITAVAVVLPVFILADRIRLPWLLRYSYHLTFGLRHAWSTPVPRLTDPPPAGISVAGGMTEALWFAVPPVLYLVSAILLSHLARRRRCPLSEIRVLMMITFWGLFAHALIVWRAGWGNLLRSLHPAYVLMAWLSCWSLTRVRSSRGIVRCAWLVPGLLPIVLFTLFMGYLLVEGDESAGAMAMRFQSNVLLDHPRARVHCDSHTAEIVEEMAQRIEELLDGDDELLALPLHPIFNFLSGHLNRGYYEWIIPGTFMDAIEERDYTENMLKRRIPLVIYRDFAIDGFEARRLPVYAPYLFDSLLNAYRFDRWIGSFALLTKRPPGLVEDLITTCALTERCWCDGSVRLGRFGPRGDIPALVLDSPVVLEIPVDVIDPVHFETGLWSDGSLAGVSVEVIGEDGSMVLPPVAQAQDGSAFITANLAGGVTAVRLSVEAGDSSSRSVWWVRPVCDMLGVGRGEPPLRSMGDGGAEVMPGDSESGIEK
ncbi:hypothetical protein JW905_17435 [bacterium]|nr:hypothetical protein [candidate division CSSED10-310 bacterium]